MNPTFKKEILDLMARVTSTTDVEISRATMEGIEVKGFDELKLMVLTSAGTIVGKVSSANFPDFEAKEGIDVTKLVFYNVSNTCSENSDIDHQNECVLLEEAILTNNHNHPIPIGTVVVFFDQVVAASLVS